ncbi:BolA family protein [Xanthobacter autotrophicus]|uniref:BolA family protein n=1 Tax=Xanthobacter autotrophicus TaxID=280 RepID=UPI0024A6418D|nr:BolA family protein [Xanthobacter autotrophicus]MDI4657265.1 BolA family transcriptional regulator [Xanthobacter autotrophicus]
MSQTSLSAIRQTLEQGLTPVFLELEDESHKHAGHAGVSHQLKGAEHREDGGVTHLRVRVVAPDFTGKSRIERHRMVNGLLQGEIAKGLHAISIDAKAPGE